MLLHSLSASAERASTARNKAQPNYRDKIVRKEILFSMTNPREKSSGLLSEAQSAIIAKADRHKLNRKLDSIPTGLKEQIRQNYLLSLDIQQRNNQEKQCIMLEKYVKMLRERTIELGLDYRKYSIGGHDKGLYEKMFKLEPSKYMSCAQFVAVMRRVFNFKYDAATERNLAQLYRSFDVEKNDKVDWRAFLTLLAIIMQPHLACQAHMNIAYAIFGSSGSLDFECRDKLTLGMIKDFMQVPVVLVSRAAVRRLVDDAWFELIDLDWEALKLSHAKSVVHGDHDEIALSFRLFNRLISETSFRVNLEAAQVFGKRDSRPLVYVLEDNYYHPRILSLIRSLRRYVRNENEADAFVEHSRIRRKRLSIMFWKAFFKRRQALRKIIATMYVNWLQARVGVYFDRWKHTSMCILSAVAVQRVGRGYIGRQRRYLMKELNNSAILLQSASRQLVEKSKLRKTLKRRYWAAVTIQRCFRGLHARRKTTTMVYAHMDVLARQLNRDRAIWHMDRQRRAAERIKQVVQRFVRRTKRLRAMKIANDVDLAESMMEAGIREAQRAKLQYRTELQSWYVKRKKEYEVDRLHEEQTAVQKKNIVSYRRRMVNYEREQREQRRREIAEKAEEARIEEWMRDWEQKKIDRVAAREAEIRHSLLAPDTQEQKTLRKVIKERIKKQLPVVLKRADKMRIPMEIPEAMELSREEIIEQEKKEEAQRVDQDMHDAAVRYEEQQEAKRIHEAEVQQRYKDRMKEWAATTIQSYVRQAAALKRTRGRAYKRFKKHFDTTALSYYYENTKTKVTSWEKPKIFGTYDVDPEDKWVVIRDAHNDPYYYNILSWQMQWEQPETTVLCEVCKAGEFAVAQMEEDGLKYCDSCMYTRVQALLATGLKPSGVKFRPFNGCKEGAANINLKYIKLDNWQMHMALGATGTDLRKESIAQDDPDDSDDDEVLICTRCQTEKAVVMCGSCEAEFCDKCFERKHKAAMWSNHVAKPLKSIFVYKKK